MPRFTLTNRSDVFESDDEAGWTDGSQVWGGNGSDTIRASDASDGGEAAARAGNLAGPDPARCRLGAGDA